MYSSAIYDSSFKLDDWIERCTKDKNTISQVRQLWSDLQGLSNLYPLSGHHENTTRLRKRTLVHLTPSFLISRVFDEQGQAILERLRADVRTRYGSKLRRMWLATVTKAEQLVYRSALRSNMTARLDQATFDTLLQAALGPLRALCEPSFINQIVSLWNPISAVLHTPSGEWGISINGIAIYVRVRLYLAAQELEANSCPITPKVLKKILFIPSFRFDGPDPPPGESDCRHYWMRYSPLPNGEVYSSRVATPSLEGFKEWHEV